MSISLKKHVEKILNEIDGSSEEKNDIYEELLGHLQLASEDLERAGLSKQEAEARAIKQFGDSKEVGSQIQEAMYPLRRVLLIILATISLLYTYAVYLIELLIEGDAHYVWLLSSVASSSLLLLIGLQIWPSKDRKIVLNSVLVVHSVIYLIGIAHPTFLAVVAWLIVGFSILLIYRTSMVDYELANAKNKKAIKICHFYNITSGLIIVGATLFFLWGILAFSDTFETQMLLLLIPFVAWVITYYLQMILLYRDKVKLAIFIALIPLLIVLAILIFYFSSIFLGGDIG